MTICGGCGLAGTRENHWQPPEHKCPRWNTEYEALRYIASLAESIYRDTGNEMLGSALERLHGITEKCKQVDYEKAIADYTCTVCGKLDPTSPGKCQKCSASN